MTGKDYYCKDIISGETVAYFRAVMTPQLKEGKLEISHQVCIQASQEDLLMVASVPVKVLLGMLGYTSYPTTRSFSLRVKPVLLLLGCDVTFYVCLFRYNQGI